MVIRKKKSLRLNVTSADETNPALISSAGTVQESISDAGADQTAASAEVINQTPMSPTSDTSGLAESQGQEEREVPMTDTQPDTQVIKAEQAAPDAAPAREKVDEIIRHRVYASLAVGLVPVPLADLGALTAVQLELIYRLSEVYNVPFNRHWVRKGLALILGSLTPVLFAPSFSGLLRYVPVAGQSLGAAGGSISFAAATYLIGHAFARRFAKGESIDDQEVRTIAKEIKDGFESGKARVKGLFGGGKPEAGEASEA